MDIVKTENLTVKYQTYEVLKDVSFTVEKGDYVAIVGPNGAGKTTLVKTLLGLLTPSDGTCRINSDKTGYLQQKVSVNDPRFPANVREIIKSGLLIGKRFPKIYTRSDNAMVDDIISKIGIDDLADRMIGSLSGGELQKVLLCRALISDPDVLFLDEPTTALDPGSRENFYKSLKVLNEKQKITIMLISHDIGSVGKYAKRLLYIDRKLIFYGTFEDFCASDDMTDYFGNISQHFFCQRHH